ncbi:MAG: tail fiber protein [[Actinobacillus] rossii]|nr:tail fiber protein [[Actinobacillus] rossii]
MAGLILTPEWTEEIYQLETSDPVMGGPDGIDNRQAIQLGKRTEYLKQEVEKCAPSASPAFTGTPTAPTPSQTVSNAQVATTEFVKEAIAALVGSAPATLDTLAEIATALGNDGKIKEVLLAEIAKKANTTDFNNLKNLLVGIPFPYPLAAVPSGCLAFNGQAFNKTTYPILAQKYPSGVLPDLRGEFLRFWDNGRGVDSGRGLLSSQGDAIRNIVGSFRNLAYQDLLVEDIGDGAFRQNRAANNTIFAPSNYISKSSGDELIFNASFVVPTANENRPRNIAFQAICLAA